MRDEGVQVGVGGLTKIPKIFTFEMVGDSISFFFNFLLLFSIFYCFFCQLL